MAYHIRFTPHDLKYNEGQLSKFLEPYDKFIVARETKSKTGESVPLHYHIYLESLLQLQSIRHNFKQYIEIPAGGKGQNNKYYSIKTWTVGEISYIVKQGDIRLSSGYTLTALESAIAGYKRNTEVEKEKEKEKAERLDEWTKLLNHFIENKTIFIGKPLSTYKHEITSIYLKKLRPVPRNGDIHRYAFSLYAILNSRFCNNEEDLNKHITDYLNSHVLWT